MDIIGNIRGYIEEIETTREYEGTIILRKLKMKRYNIHGKIIN